MSGQRCCVVAEAGINHNGSLARALEMVHAAADAGCDAFKVQAYTTAEFVGPSETYTYLEGGGDGSPMRRVTERQVDMFDRCALDAGALVALHAECQKRKLHFVVTATDAKWVARVKALKGGLVILKVGSDDLIHLPLLRIMAASGLPVVLSTGMATTPEIERALAIVRPMVLMHCVSLYPTPPTQVNLLRMVTLSHYGHSVGYSDHTQGSVASMLAVGIGASMIEKHFTLDNKLPGPDHWFSADPKQMKDLVTSVRVATFMRGSGVVAPGKQEAEMRATARRSVVLDEDLPAGAVLRQEHVAYRRPGTGMPPGTEAAILGRQAARAFKAGEVLDPTAFFEPGQVVH